jgi:hypothetical protein
MLGTMHSDMQAVALTSDDLLREQSYLVARGVRSLALAGHCENESLTMLRIATRLEALAEAGAIPFVIDRGDGWADFGFAASGWVLDLYAWLSKDTQDAVPEPQRSRILGLLLGYSVEAIRLFEEGRGGRLFNASVGSTPSSRLCGSASTEENALHS